MPLRAVFLLLLSLFCADLCRADTYSVVTSHSQVRFSVKKWSVLDVDGLFRTFYGTIRYDPARPQESSVEVKVNVSSVATGEIKRDESLAMPEFFDAARHPEMTFRSTSVSGDGAGTLVVKGNLTIKGTPRIVSIRVQPLGVQQIPGEGEIATFTTEFTIDRRDYGVLGGTLSRTMVGNEVKIRLTLGAKRLR